MTQDADCPPIPSCSRVQIAEADVESRSPDPQMELSGVQLVQPPGMHHYRHKNNPSHSMLGGPSFGGGWAELDCYVT